MRKNKYLIKCIHNFATYNNETRTKLVTENTELVQTALYHLAMCQELGDISNKEGSDFNFILNFNLADLEASLMLASYGFYSQAKAILRMVLDTAVREIYFEEITPESLAFEKDPVKNRLPPFKVLFGEYLAWKVAQGYDKVSLDEKMYLDMDGKTYIKFSDYIIKLYKDLCFHVHPGGTSARLIIAEDKQYIGNVVNKDAFLDYLADFFDIAKILCIFVLLLEGDLQHGKKPTLFKHLYKKEYNIICEIDCKYRP